VLLAPPSALEAALAELLVLYDLPPYENLAMLLLYYTIYVCVPTTVQVSAAEQIVNTPLSSTISPTSHVAGSVLYLGTFNSVLNRDALLKS